MNYRPTVDEYFIIMTMHVSSRGTCLRRKVGCVLVDEHRHVLATGYNGPASGQPNCMDNPCAGATAASGQSLHLCRAIHAEDNALRQCGNLFNIKTAYCTTRPCTGCMDKLLKTNCERIVYLMDYPHTSAEERWLENNRMIDCIYDSIGQTSPVHLFATIYGFSK